jgi:DNA replication ATP-dependent helicase Dna2
MELISVLKELKEFVDAEHAATFEKLQEIWKKPLHEKLNKGVTQEIKAVKQVDNDNNCLEVILGGNESRFREGDMLCLHLGEAHLKRYIQQATIEAEDDDSWLLRVNKLDKEMLTQISAGCYADPDAMDLTPFYDKALGEIAESKFGREIILPLLAGKLDTDFIFESDYDDAADYAQDRKLNEQQSDAVGKGVASKYLACIQGPPGTGKTKVISLIAKLLVKSGQRVLMTSHTHMAINNALNKIAEENVPVIKVCAKNGTKALSVDVSSYAYASQWKEMPDSGYVIGATPFATCSERLEDYDFDTVIFDEASQITLPLALMAMRKGRRFIFVGDHKQLPPVILSESVLTDCSAFSRMITTNQEVSVLLNQTYRMSQALTIWPSHCYYDGKLISERPREKSIFTLPHKPKKYMDILSGEHPFVFIKTPGINARSANQEEAKLVAELIEITTEAGLSAEEIGVVTPFRNHAKVLKSYLANKLGIFTSTLVVTDTVERMQGQEREMIIISLCSSDPQYISAIAPFFFQPERLNVAITRAQTKLILIGPDLPKSFLFETADEELRENISNYHSLICHGYYVG